MLKSSQLNFYIHPDDLAEIEPFLKGLGALFISQPTIDDRSPFINSIRYPKPENQFDKIYLVQNASLTNLIFDKIDKQDYFLIRDIPSYVVEFSRGGFLFDKNRLERSRLYFVTSYNENNLEIMKSKEFVNWSKKIFKEFKKNFLIKTSWGRDYYFSKRVIDWRETNKAELDPAGLRLIAGL